MLLADIFINESVSLIILDGRTSPHFHSLTNPLQEMRRKKRIVMKKFKYLLIAAMTLVLSACSAPIDDVADQIRQDIINQIDADYVGEVILVHKGGNDYKGMVDIQVDGYVYTCSLEVTYDGYAYTWELYE